MSDERHGCILVFDLRGLPAHQQESVALTAIHRHGPRIVLVIAYSGVPKTLAEKFGIPTIGVLPVPKPLVPRGDESEWEEGWLYLREDTVGDHVGKMGNCFIVSDKSLLLGHMEGKHVEMYGEAP